VQRRDGPRRLREIDDDDDDDRSLTLIYKSLALEAQSLLTSLIIQISPHQPAPKLKTEDFVEVKTYCPRPC